MVTPLEQITRGSARIHKALPDIADRATVTALAVGIPMAASAGFGAIGDIADNTAVEQLAALGQYGAITAGTALAFQQAKKAYEKISKRPSSTSTIGTLRSYLQIGALVALGMSAGVPQGNTADQRLNDLASGDYVTRAFDPFIDKLSAVDVPESPTRQTRNPNGQSESEARDTNSRRYQIPTRQAWAEIEPGLELEDIYGRGRIQEGEPNYDILRHRLNVNGDPAHKGRGSGPHQGFDIAGPIGTPIYPIADGTIATEPGFRPKNGNTVRQWFDGPNGERLCATYIHLDDISNGLTAGSTVSMDRPIGTIGVSGRNGNDDPHVHLSIKEGGCAYGQGSPIDPTPFLRGEYN